MLHALRQHGLHVAIGQRVKNGFAVPAAFYQPALLQDTKLMGDGALVHADQIGQIADTELVLAETPQNLDPGGIAKPLEEPGHICKQLGARTSSTAA